MKTFKRKVEFNPNLFGALNLFLLGTIVCMAALLPCIAFFAYGNFVNGTMRGGFIGLVCLILGMVVLTGFLLFTFFKNHFDVQNHKKFVTNLEDTLEHTFVVKDFRIGFTKKFAALVTPNISTDIGVSFNMKKSDAFKYIDRFVFLLVSEDGIEYFVDYDMFTAVFIGNKVSVKSSEVYGVHYVKQLDVLDDSLIGDKVEQEERKKELFKNVDVYKRTL